MPRNPLQSPADALRFLVSFAQMEIKRVKSAELNAAERCVRQLITLTTLEQAAGPSWASREWVNEPPVRRRELQRLHADTRSFLMGIAIDGDAVVTVNLRFAAARTPPSSRSGSTARPAHGNEVWLLVNGSARDRFLYRVIRLLDELGASKLCQCAAPDCRRLFFKVTRKEFCSTKCQSRVYMRNYRE